MNGGMMNGGMMNPGMMNGANPAMMGGGGLAPPMGPGGGPRFGGQPFAQVGPSELGPVQNRSRSQPIFPQNCLFQKTVFF